MKTKRQNRFDNMKKGQVNAKYEEKYIKANRTFPVWRTVLFVLLIPLQILFPVLAFLANPQPQDRILQYNVTVQPLNDGSLDIDYHFVWEPLDEYEELTWVEIGIANPNYSVYRDSVSNTVINYEQEDYGDEVYLVLDLDRGYTAGEVLEFSFKINQRDMLCRDEQGYFYEFVPCWFNATPVEQYTFRWIDDEGLLSVTDARKEAGSHVRSGSFECGEYGMLRAQYDSSRFRNCPTAEYQPFDDSGVTNELKSEKIAMIIVAFVFVAIAALTQMWLVDTVVSYYRGRGFLSGHGYAVHTFGRTNPWYTKAHEKHMSTYRRRSGGGGGGCACACACACAGGGRAGCSQKDTFDPNS